MKIPHQTDVGLPICQKSNTVPTASPTYKLLPLPLPLPPSSPALLALFSFVLLIASLMPSLPPILPGPVLSYPFCGLPTLSLSPTPIAKSRPVSSSPRTISPSSLLPTSRFCFLFKAPLSPPPILTLPLYSIPSSLPSPLLQALPDSPWSSPPLCSPRTS